MTQLIYLLIRKKVRGFAVWDSTPPPVAPAFHRIYAQTGAFYATHPPSCFVRAGVFKIDIGTMVWGSARGFEKLQRGPLLFVNRPSAWLIASSIRYAGHATGRVIRKCELCDEHTQLHTPGPVWGKDRTACHIRRSQER